MKYSFVIASLNDKNQRLQDCINSIEMAYEHLKCHEIEIAIVFQNVKESDCNFKIKYPQFTRFYYIDKKGQARARNHAIKRSDADFFIFLDDHAQINEDFLEVLSNNCSITDAEAFCGRLLERDTNKCFGICFEDNRKRYLNCADFRYFLGSAHVLKNTIIAKVGFYDEEFEPGAKYPAAGDSDMFFRIKRCGVKIIYIPQLIFFHPINYVTEPSKVFNYCYAWGAMITKQMFLGKKYILIYLYLVSEIIFKSFLRTIQTILFPWSIAEKNARFQYKSVLLGTISGALGYIKDKKTG